MIRTLLISAAAACVAGAAVAQTTDYPPCKHRGDDKCRVVTMEHRHHHMMRHHRHHMMRHDHDRGHDQDHATAPDHDQPQPPR